MGLNKHSHVPLYRQLVEQLTGKIQSGELKPGERVLSERELAEHLNVSRTTARLAIDELVSTGLVYREQGRGTFVAEPAMRSLMGFASFSEDLIARGYSPGSKILAQDMITGDETTRKALKLTGDSKVFYLKRLRLADDQPVAIQRAYMPQALVPGLETEDLSNRSVYAILREKYYVYPAWTEAEMEALPATDEQSALLEINPGAPVLVIRGISYTDSFDIVESVETTYRGKGLAVYIGRQRIQTLR